MPPSPPTPETGRIEAGVHRLALRVYYEDTDAGGIVYHANHLKFAERARTEMLRCLGLDHGTLRQRFGLAFTVRRCVVDYRAPARLDDGLVIETGLVRQGAATLDLEQRVTRAGRLLVRLELRLALVSAEMRVARLPAELRAALAPLGARPLGHRA
jgi:acyl-CoA thioester hydrolase